MHKKTVFTLLLFLSSSTITNGQNNETMSTQNNLTGKTYIAKVGESCKEMIDGGCMIYTFCILKFEKDSVIVSYRVKADCSPKSREKAYEHSDDNLKSIYKWTSDSQNIVIKNFNDYGKLILQGNTIVGKIKMNNNEFKKLEFVQERN